MRVMIAYPPLDGKGSPMLTQNRQFQWFHEPSYLYPCVPASAATLLQQRGHEVVWVDAHAERRSWAGFARILRDARPQLVAVETKTPVARRHYAVLGRIKELVPGVVTVLMGDHVTARPAEAASQEGVDFALLGGDYDFSLLRLVEYLEGGGALGPGFAYMDGDRYVHTGPAPLDGDLESLPWMDRDLTNAHLYFEKWKYRLPFMWTMAGRDCPWHQCTFCSWTTLWPRFRTVSPERLADEMSFLVRRYGARNLFDDTGTLPGGGWLERLTSEMIARRLPDDIVFDCNFRFDQITPRLAERMKRAGFRKLLVGLESANPDTLIRLRKGVTRERIEEGAAIASRAGLQLQITVMVGYPWETREDALTTLRFARDLLYRGHAHHLQATVITPYPGTPLYQECRDQGWFRVGPEDWDRFDMTEPVCDVPGVEPEEMLRLAQGFYRLYLDPRFVSRQLLQARSLDDLDYLARGTRAIWGHLKDFATIRR